MDQTAGWATAVNFLRNLTAELRDYTPALRKYLKANARQMTLSGRLALESGVRSYEELLRWSRSSLAKYVRKKKGGRRA
jgi:hypothetical protein